MNSLSEVWNTIAILWGIANFWTRWAVRIILLWPLAVIAIALIGFPFWVSIAALVPAVAFVLFFATRKHPLVFPLITAIPAGKQVFGWLAVLAGSDMLLGLYFGIVPVANNRSLMPYFLLAWAGLLFLSLARVLDVKARLVKSSASLCILVMIIITILWFKGESNWFDFKTKTIIIKQGPPPITRPSQQLEEVAAHWREQPQVQYSKTAEQWQPTIFKEGSIGTDEMLVSVNGTNEWSKEAPEAWYHFTGMKLYPNEGVAVTCVNPHTQLSYNMWGAKTPVWGEQRNTLPGSEDEPKFGFSTFGAVYIVLLNSPSQKDGAQAKTFLPNTHRLPIWNNTNQIVFVGLHRNLPKRYFSADKNKVFDDGFSFSGLVDPTGQDHWEFFLKKLR